MRTPDADVQIAGNAKSRLWVLRLKPAPLLFLFRQDPILLRPISNTSLFRIVASVRVPRQHRTKDDQSSFRGIEKGGNGPLFVDNRQR